MALLENVNIIKISANTFALSNTSGQTISYTLSSKNCLDEEVIIKQGTLANNREVIFLEVQFKDGNYTVTAVNSEDSVILPFKNYDNLLYSIIKDTELFLCGCKCQECDDCNEADCSDHLNLLQKMLSLQYLRRENYTPIPETINIFDCVIQEGAECIVTNEMLLGKFNKEELLYKALVSRLYMLFYYTEVVNNSPDKFNSIKLFFRSSKILSCISKLGFNITTFINTTIPQEGR